MSSNLIARSSSDEEAAFGPPFSFGAQASERQSQYSERISDLFGESWQAVVQAPLSDGQIMQHHHDFSAQFATRVSPRVIIDETYIEPAAAVTLDAAPPSGWWLLPMILAGIAFWAGVFVVVTG